MKSKLLSIVLSLALLFSFIPVLNVYADATEGSVVSVPITVTPPTVGEKSSDVRPQVSVEGEHVSLQSVVWLYGLDMYSTGEPDVTFESGKTYYIYALIKADPGWYYICEPDEYTGIDEGFLKFKGCTVSGGTLEFAGERRFDGIDYLRVKISVEPQSSAVKVMYFIYKTTKSGTTFLAAMQEGSKYTVPTCSDENFAGWSVVKDSIEIDKITKEQVESGYQYTLPPSDSPSSDSITFSALYETPSTPSHVHSLTKVNKVNPTCTEPGAEEYWKCSCGKMFSDIDGQVEIPKPIVYSALGHDLKTVETPAGLLKNGSSYQKCTRCSFKTQPVVIPGWSKSYVKSVKLAKGKKFFKVKWKKQSKKNQKKFNGYQMRYSTKSNFANAQYATAKRSASMKKIKGKSRTKYYVQVRTYKVIDGVKYYSSWSKTKSVKVK